MLIIEQDVMNSIICNLPKIVEQLEIANKLKALELKGRQDLNISPEMIDNAMSNN